MTRMIVLSALASVLALCVALFQYCVARTPAKKLSVILPITVSDDLSRPFPFVVAHSDALFDITGHQWNKIIPESTEDGTIIRLVGTFNYLDDFQIFSSWHRRDYHYYGGELIKRSSLAKPDSPLPVEVRNLMAPNRVAAFLVGQYIEMGNVFYLQEALDRLGREFQTSRKIIDALPSDDDSEP